MLNKIVYIYNEQLINQSNRLPSFKNRASMVQDLMNSYGLLLDDRFLIVQSRDASEEELKSFHSTDYIEFLKKMNDLTELEFEEYNEEQLEYGLGYDCPILEKQFDLVKTIAGGSISATLLLNARKCQTAINWFGGWHHAQRDAAEGFCYVNDIVLAIQMLTKSFEKILYIDLDIHHGNGVQNAFEFSNKILTLSFHKVALGFYPGTGNLNDIGQSKGQYYSLNVPLLDGIGHVNFVKIFDQVYEKVFSKFKPDAIVVQCGADGLNGDRIGECNLTLESFGDCVKNIMKCNLPTLYLGGGGYNFPNTARLWTYLSSVIAGIDLDEDIPDSCKYFTKYGPTYEINIDASLKKDLNTEEHIQNIFKHIEFYCSFIS